MKNYSMLELAFLGDSVHTLFVRESILKNSCFKLNEIHKMSSRLCSAKFQSSALDKLVSLLTDEEKEIVRMARNSKPKHSAKNSDPATYHKATAFEALIGWLYLNNRQRLEFILTLSLNEKE